MKNILVINAGSSSLKYQLIDMDAEKVLAKGNCERIGIDNSRLKHESDITGKVTLEHEMKDHSDAIKFVIETLTNAETGVIKSMSDIYAVGHRVVHGGEYFSDSVIINDEVKEKISVCSELAPLHNPANLIGIAACEGIMPGVPQVAVFDTAFHQTMPREAYLYAIPYEYYKKYKIRRYGFHGTSHRFVSQRVAELMGKPIEELRIITLHLGNGASCAAVKYGKSIDTSMGFTPLAGVIMATRSGDIDPAIVPYVMEKEGISAKEINNILNKESGMWGVTGISKDFRDIELSGKDGNEDAQLGLAMFNYSVKRYIGMYASAMGGVDAVVFTAGVGENNALMREQVIAGHEYLGMSVDHDKNQVRSVEADITGKDSKVKVFVIPTNEELMIAKDTLALVENK